MKFPTIIASAMAFFPAWAVAAASPRVTLGQGPIAGLEQAGVDAYLGIPYVAPPTGENRWRSPQPVKPHKQVRDATHFGPSCPQTIAPGGIGPWTQEYVPSGEVSEDCLTLNVWTPHKTQSRKLPVLVWIHGGGFTSGSASVPVYDGAALAAQGVVVVSINYRLGFLGFLASSEVRDHGGGNFGFQDQIAALRWIAANIRTFGGDPRRVTIAGQSAGAISVHALMLAKQARGLFQRAIPQSGIGLGLDPAMTLPPLQKAEQGAATFLASAGAASLSDARKLPLKTLTEAFAKHRGQPGLGPYADGTLLPLDPAAALASGAYNDTPVLIGMTADEGSGLNINYRVADSSRYEALVKARLGELAPEFLKVYPASDPAKSFPALIRDGGLASVLDWADLRARSSRQPLFAYMWTHVEPGPQSARYGAFHTSEVPYVFQTLDKAPDRGFTAADRRLSQMLSRYWLNFIRTGNPNDASAPLWPQYSPAGNVQELGSHVGLYVPLDPGARALFRRHVAGGKSLLVF